MDIVLAAESRHHVEQSGRDSLAWAQLGELWRSDDWALKGSMSSARHTGSIEGRWSMKRAEKQWIGTVWGLIKVVWDCLFSYHQEVWRNGAFARSSGFSHPTGSALARLSSVCQQAGPRYKSP